MLIDSFGRKLNYLRISVTDRCNLRCVYCMPSNGVEWKPHRDILTFEEILRITEIMAGLGISRIKVTGGEPLLRKGCASFLEKLKAVNGIENVTLTTNGLLLRRYLDEVEKNISLPDGINISIDALDAQRYMRITRCEAAHTPDMILSLIRQLLNEKINVKINCVPVCSFNEEEIIPIAALAKDKNIIVRFIELMPLGSASEFQSVPGAEVAEKIEKTFGKLVPFNGISGNGPALYYSLQDFAGKIGFINAITHGFCETCNRLRLTSDGLLKLCLSDDMSLDIREMARNGQSDSGIAQRIAEFAACKPRFHSLSSVYGRKEKHSEGMSAIGG
ncbi:MAG: GTP 3',8-cyclase MoaA [Treponema sp.]|nr:GTP 3',8-cyclase MoaA [Treponema sp.]MCL2181059.1 GTP 3',8-cyclase MoaA [Treponema sp.]